MNKLQEIIHYYVSSEIEKIEINTINLSFMIAKYAHRDQFRENGENYFNHPKRLFERFQKILNIDYKNINTKDIMNLNKYEIPYFGVLEVALLHDVVENTDLTIADIKEIFIKSKMIDYFELFIEKPLSLITHNKQDDYQSYISKVLEDDVSAMVKMLDLEDNCSMFSLISIDDYKVNRTKKYINYFNEINNKYHYVEKIHNYCKEQNK